MKVYVVTAGSYSDYHIVSIFTDKKVANKFNKEMLLNENSVLTMKTDVIPKTPVGRYPYLVQMKYDGTFVRIDRKSYDCFVPCVYITTFGGKDDFNQMHACVWAKDEKHAVKIASEKRTQMIAKNEWLPDKISIEKARAKGEFIEDSE